MKMMIKLNSTIIIAFRVIAVMMHYGAISLLNRQHSLRPTIVGLIIPMKVVFR